VVKVVRGIHEPFDFVENLAGTTSVSAGFLEREDLLVQLTNLNIIISLLGFPAVPEDHNCRRQKDEDDKDPNPWLHGRGLSLRFSIRRRGHSAGDSTPRVN
jgi:hypothetical protein